MRVFPVVGVLALASCLALTGCRKKAESADEGPGATPESSVTEESENGSVTWDVGTDGKVRGKVKTTDGRVVSKDITGTLLWPGDVVDEERDVTLDEDGMLVAEGPALEDDLTEIDFNLTVEGKPWSGVLHVPRGGTKAIDDDAKVAANLTVPEGKRGPNGGVIQYVGGEPVELVADKDSKEVRVYILNRDYTVVDPGERTVRLAYGAQYPGMQVLVREPNANYYVGPWYPDYNPYRITVAVTLGTETHVGIVGWRWGERWRWGVPAPVAFVGVRAWVPSVAIGVGVGWGWGWGWGYRGGYAVRGIETVRVGGRVVVGGSVRGGPGVVVGGGGRGGDHGGGRGHEGGGDHGGRGHEGGGDHGGRGHEAGGDHGGRGHEAGGGDHGGHAAGGHAASPGGGHAGPAGGHGSPGGGGHAAPSRGGTSRPSGGGRHR